VYLDHAGTTPYPTSTILQHSKDLTTNLFSNPHSKSPSSLTTTNRIAAIRRRLLAFFNASPEFFDVVFVANATAGIKLIADGFAGHISGFEYTYLRDVHTSLVGVAGLARTSCCLSENEVDDWLSLGRIGGDGLGLFAYPAQSNFNGRRFPLEWIPRLRDGHPNRYILLDAASYLTTTPLDFSNSIKAPDFTVLSLYKIFGYPDLGAVIIRREAGHILLQRKFFGGGTRAAITSDSFHAPRKELHAALEDGTLPFHTILAVDAAMDNHSRLFGSHTNVSRHTAAVTRLMYSLLSSLRHYNGWKVCEIYSPPNHGPILAFNLFSSTGTPIGFASFEKLSSLRNFALRTGGMCNPGGVEQYLGLQSWEVERNFGRGKVCGDDMDVMEGKSTGVVRVSFGACSTVEEVCAFEEFIREYYVEKGPVARSVSDSSTAITLKSMHICTSNIHSTNPRPDQILPRIFRPERRALARHPTGPPPRPPILPHLNHNRPRPVPKAVPPHGTNPPRRQSRHEHHVSHLTSTHRLDINSPDNGAGLGYRKWGSTSSRRRPTLRG
jgi:molybdenum cofactor sulfurtransferase